VTRSRITKASANVFADLGFKRPQEEVAKVELAYEIRSILIERRLSQMDAAGKLGISQPDVSKLMNLRPHGFTLDRLLVILTNLRRDVEIRVTRAPRSRRSGTIRTTLPVG
jgi:predicted XRE-type DNA-binding protein